MLRAAVIGVGSMGRNHARIYKELAETELVGVADTNQQLASQIAARYGVPFYTQYSHLLEQTFPDIISIAVPTADHSIIAINCLQAGAHLLIEKPIAATIEQGRNIIRTAGEHSRKLMIGHVVRFNPAIQALKERLEAGDIGRVYQIICRRVGPFPARIRDVGVVVDLAPHDLDIMRYLTGLDPVRVYAETVRRIHTEHEDLLLGTLRFPGDITCSLEINWLSPSKIREVLVLGEGGMYRVDDLTQDLYFYESAHPEGSLWPALRHLKGISEGSMIRFSLKRYEPLKAEIFAFVQSILNGTDVPVSGEDGLEALRLALALIESGRRNQVVEVASES